MEKRKNAKKPASIAAAIASVHRSRVDITIPPTFTVATPHGSLRLSASKPQIAVTTCSMMNSRPIVTMITANVGSPTMWRRTVRSIAAPISAADATARITASTNGSPAPLENA